jgi:hypothetical protein
MKKLTSFPGLAALALAFALAGLNAAAQPPGGGRGGFGGMMGDPAQRAQTQVDALRDSIGVTNNDEWAVISPRLLKVVQLKSDQSMAEIARMMAPMMAQFGGAMPADANPFGVKPDAASDALKNALDKKAPIAEVKAALAKFREARTQKQAEMTKAQDDLKAVLSVRQEAALVSSGYLE